MASIQTRLYRGELGYDFIGRRRLWYIASAVFMAFCLISMIFRGFNYGIEFEGGNSFQFPGTEQQLEQAEAAVTDSGVEVVSAQVVGQDAILLRTAEISNETAAEVSGAIADTLGIDVSDISNSAVSAQWGGDITNKALQALAVFLVAVVIFIAIRFQPKMAVAALAALVNDLIVAAGVYSLVGFEVTPSTVIGLLTILGFSLYDTVVVFDKVDENTRGILGGSRTTYSEAANLAVNQTLMRSINTSLIALLPVAGLLFVGAGLLGAGTLKDLALVLFVGLATGAYSSIFLATPILCDLKEREPAYVALRKRVEARKASGRGADAEPARPVRPARRQGKTAIKQAPAKKAPPGKQTPARKAAAAKQAPAKKAAAARQPPAKAAPAVKAAPAAKAAPAVKAAPGKVVPTTKTAAGEPSLAKPTGAAAAPLFRSGRSAADGRTRDKADDESALRPSARRVRPALLRRGRGTAIDDTAKDAGDVTGDDTVDDTIEDTVDGVTVVDSDTETDSETDADYVDDVDEVGTVDDVDEVGTVDDVDEGEDAAGDAESQAARTPAARAAAAGKTGQRARTGRPAGKSNPRRGRPSGKRKR